MSEDPFSAGAAAGGAAAQPAAAAVRSAPAAPLPAAPSAAAAALAGPAAADPAASSPARRSHQRSLGIDISSSRSTAAAVITASTNSGVLAMDSQTTAPAKSAAYRYMIMTLERCE